ncbi:MAG: dihydroorotate dehydrogenase [Candidatus Eisenbacteria bacterium]|uniref:Dihydroorotate dehydrogenase n=1 Tax=Eiseniibacteriota bacterium TaxID=2212470 RepID=A0A7Y2H412_UNCEI|nr:dihydroorotate dehydrogenase [Candidatus Eisenbacteria bacterium]
MSKLSITAGGLKLKNPVLIASGIGGYGAELIPLLDLEAIGGVVTKTIFEEPRPGNPPPRIAETPNGMLNSIGLEGPGIERYEKEKLTRLEGLDTRIVVSIGGYGPEDFAKLAERLDDLDRVDAIELNISCPNVKEGGLNMSTHPNLAEEVVVATRRVTKKPLWAKLTPNVTSISDVGRACLHGGADALSAINTLLGMRIDVDRREPLLARGMGGLSGPAIRPVALAKCFELVRALNCDVVGIGGVEDTSSALEFLVAGCKAIQVGTVVYAEPQVPVDIVAGIEAYMDKHGFTELSQVIGTLKVEETLLIGPKATKAK